MVRAVLILVLLNGVAMAADVDKAREAFESASKHWDLGEFEAALADFKDAYRSVDDPKLLFNIAQCYRMLGDTNQALRNYKNYLIKVPQAPNEALVRQLIDDLEKRRSDQPAPKTTPPRETPLAATPPPAPPAPRAAATPSVAATRPTPVYKRWWLWTLVGAAAAGAAVGLGVGLSGSPDHTPTATTSFGTFRPGF